MSMLICEKCHVTKPEIEFQTKTLIFKCKKCHNKEHYFKNREYYIAKMNKRQTDPKTKRKVQDYRNGYYRKKRKNDIQFKIKVNLRSRFYKVLKGLAKSATTIDLLGCSVVELIKHIESLWQSGMTWDNYGKWHIDHIKPLSSFNLISKEEQRKACHYSNLQPLWAIDNFKKSDRYALT
jgi:hypothetical protein